jgi:hypothetical protein
MTWSLQNLSWITRLFIFFLEKSLSQLIVKTIIRLNWILNIDETFAFAIGDSWVICAAKREEKHIK